MFGSKNDFFNQETAILISKRNRLEFLLKEVWNRSDEVVAFYLKAYDYFGENPSDYDGATIVKDLNIMPGLDVHAMIHDYMYLAYNVASDVKYKYKADLIYAYEMEKMGGSAYSTWSRFAGLTTFGFFFYLFKKLTGKKMTDRNKQNFDKIFKIFK